MGYKTIVIGDIRNGVSSFLSEYFSSKSNRKYCKITNDPAEFYEYKPLSPKRKKSNFPSKERILNGLRPGTLNLLEREALDIFSLNQSFEGLFSLYCQSCDGIILVVDLSSRSSSIEYLNNVFRDVLLRNERFLKGYIPVLVFGCESKFFDAPRKLDDIEVKEFIETIVEETISRSQKSSFNSPSRSSPERDHHDISHNIFIRYFEMFDTQSTESGLNCLMKEIQKRKRQDLLHFSSPFSSSSSSSQQQKKMKHLIDDDYFYGECESLKLVKRHNTLCFGRNFGLHEDQRYPSSSPLSSSKDSIRRIKTMHAFTRYQKKRKRKRKETYCFHLEFRSRNLFDSSSNRTHQQRFSSSSSSSSSIKNTYWDGFVQMILEKVRF